jgi:AcrR family transcriptional regulator
VISKSSAPSVRKKKVSRTPGAKRVRTREKLLNAATELFMEKGIFATSLDEVAARAGLTKGAIYGNFESKDELVFAVAMERAARPRPVFTGDAPLKEQFKTFVRTAAIRGAEGSRQLAFLTELDLYMLTHKTLKTRLVALVRERYAMSGGNLARIVGAQELPLPALQFAVVVHALVNGLLYQKALVPEIVTDGVILAALEALVD